MRVRVREGRGRERESKERRARKDRDDEGPEYCDAIIVVIAARCRGLCDRSGSAAGDGRPIWPSSSSPAVKYSSALRRSSRGHGGNSELSNRGKSPPRGNH